MSQSKVGQWLKVLLPLLEQALAKMRILPFREPSHLYVTLCLLAGKVLWLHATEREVPHSVDWEQQKYEYSGKKDCHTQKNLLVGDEQNRILYLSPTVDGSIHDKALANEMELEFLPEQNLLLELGFVGYQPEAARTILQFKKPY